jgi:hypothetical protein
MFTGPLSSKGCPSVARVRFAGMCLPSRCLTRHNNKECKFACSICNNTEHLHFRIDCLFIQYTILSYFQFE